LLKDKKNYREQLERKLEADNFSASEMQKLSLPLSLISDSENFYLSELFKSEPQGWDLRFSHNDLFYANVLLDFDTENLVLIDYEYSCMNPFMWDLGHMINEATLSYSRTLYDWPFYKYDESLFPTDSQLEEILKSYWLHDKFDHTVLDVKGSFGDQWFGNLKATKQWAEIDPGVVADLLRRFKKIMVATNYYWMIWVMLDLRNPMFPQDTLHFIGQRAQMYLDWKKKIEND
jgi:thiamine kinase-like enzyme